MKQQIEELIKIHDVLAVGFRSLPPIALVVCPSLVKDARESIHNLGSVISQLEALSAAASDVLTNLEAINVNAK